MKLSEIVNHLGTNLPRYSTKFSDTIAYSSIVAVSGIITVITSVPHNLTTNNIVTIHNMDIKHDVNSLTQTGGVVTVVLNTDHDLTENWQETITIEGANEPEFNGTFDLVSVPNRRTFTFNVSASSPATGTGTIKFLEHLEIGLDGGYSVTVVDPNTFTINTGNASLNLTGYNGTISIQQRIMGSIDIERFLEFYEKQAIDKYFAVVVLENSSTSKDRGLYSDATATSGSSSEYRQILLEPFSVYVIAPAKNDMAAVHALDNMFEEIKIALLNSLVGHTFETGLSTSTNSGVIFTGHGPFAYWKAWYVHKYTFETYTEIVIDDTTRKTPSFLVPTRAFRDAHIKFLNSFDETLITNNVDLDDQPL